MCRLQYAAFYSDSEHEILPVTSGLRISVSYNLYAKDKQFEPVIYPPLITSLAAYVEVSAHIYVSAIHVIKTISVSKLMSSVCRVILSQQRPTSPYRHLLLILLVVRISQDDAHNADSKTSKTLALEMCKFSMTLVLSQLDSCRIDSYCCDIKWSWPNQVKMELRSSWSG